MLTIVNHQPPHHKEWTSRRTACVAECMGFGMADPTIEMPIKHHDAYMHEQPLLFFVPVIPSTELYEEKLPLTCYQCKPMLHCAVHNIKIALNWQGRPDDDAMTSWSCPIIWGGQVCSYAIYFDDLDSWLTYALVNSIALGLKCCQLTSRETKHRDSICGRFRTGHF